MQKEQSSVVLIKLKWGKQLITDPQLLIEPGSTTSDALKERISILTGVPHHRQKLLAKGAWKGMLKDGIVFDKSLAKDILTITLIGSADAPPTTEHKNRFLEDLTPEELAADEASRVQEALKNSEGMIVTLQKPPIHRQDDNARTEMYQYNRLVSGLPQHQIEDLLRRQDEANPQLLGSIAMNLGMELRRAYVNALEVLPRDGTLLSASDDGHVMGWRHGERVLDVVHQGRESGGVDCLVAFPDEPSHQVAFCTGGVGCIRFWTADGDCLQSIACPPGTSPNAMVAMQFQGHAFTVLAASVGITRQVAPNQFRLVPQDEAGRQRRAMAEMQEAMIQENLARVSESVQLWFSGASQSEIQSITLRPQNGAAPITSLAVASNKAFDDLTETTFLVSGDSFGGLRFWRPNEGPADQSTAASSYHWDSEKFFQLCPVETIHVASVVCMESISKQNLLAVSTKQVVTPEVDNGRLSEATAVFVNTSQAVFLLDWNHGVIRAVLDSHRDSVICMTPLPDGGLVTGGGKMDAMLKVWEQAQWMEQAPIDGIENENQAKSEAAVVTEASSELSNIGYTFALAILPDTKAGSRKYALAAARYNVVKIAL